MSQIQFVPLEFTVKHNLDASSLRHNLRKLLEQSLKDRYEGACFQGVYIQIGSLKLQHKTLGRIAGSHFVGQITYNVIFQAEAYKPIIGDIIRTQVVSINDSGIMTQVYPFEIPMKIFLVKSQHADFLEQFKRISVNDILDVKLLDYEIKHNIIYAIGHLEKSERPEFNRNFVLKANGEYRVPLNIEILIDKEPTWLTPDLAQKQDNLNKIQSDVSNLDKDSVQNTESLINLYELITPDEKYLEKYPDLLPEGSIMTLEPPATSADYYKLWEILKEFLIVGDRSTEINAFVLAQNPGYLQCLINYRKNPNDKIYAVLQEPWINPDVQLQTADFKSQAELSSPDFLLDRVYNDFDISEDSSTGFNLIITCAEATQPILLAEIFLALSSQRENGTLIIRFGDIFTQATGELIALLITYYGRVTMYKPKTTSIEDSERFIIASGFKIITDSSHRTPMREIGKDILRKLETLEADSYVKTFFNFDVLLTDNNFIETLDPAIESLVDGQIVILNRVYESINNTVSLDVGYHQTEQKIAAQEWAENYLSSGDYDISRIHLTKQAEQAQRAVPTTLLLEQKPEEIPVQIPQPTEKSLIKPPKPKPRKVV